MGLSRRMGLTISSLAFAAATVGTLGAAESASAQATTVVPQHAVTSPSLATHRGRGRQGRTYSRTTRWRNTGRSYSSYSYYKKTTYWFFWGGCGCCC
jgi:hypothetical protein